MLGNGLREKVMKRTLQLAILAGMLVVLSATSAKADSNLAYTLIQDGSTTPLATWDMPLNPTPACVVSPCYENGNYFGFTTDVSIDGGPPVSDILVFMNTGVSNIDFNDASFLLPELLGPQLYSGNESNPQMIIPPNGFFTLVDDGTNGVAGTVYKLEVVETPEPATLLLLGSGLVAIGMMRKRRAAY
jgi:PEP-CTERM motif